MNHCSRLLTVSAVALAAVGSGTVHFADAGTPATAMSVVPVEPYRILDTRAGVGAPRSPLGAGQTINVQIAGVGPVPADAVGVVLNITGTRTSEPTYITAWPAGAVQPTASVLNLTPGIDAPNGVTALLGGGRLSLFNFSGSTDLIADVAGYLVPGAGNGATAGPAGPQGPVGPPGPAGPGGVSEWQAVTRTGTISAGSTFGAVTADCPAGNVAVGGGGFSPYASEIFLLDSYPATNGAGWNVSYNRLNPGTTTTTRSFTAYAVCVIAN